MVHTFYWHDYETWGADPVRDRAAQFAGIRTDDELNVVGRPLNLYCRPAFDMLPQPEACLVTGITPQRALAEGVDEAEFFQAVHGELARSGTCGLGYNSIRFDDEVTRHGFYRNFIDPYAREWRDGNSRWDLIDVVRLTRALRPEGIEWPEHEPGVPSFRLEHLAAANGLAHDAAHDALSDVMATIELARLIRSRQPRLFDYLFRMRGKRQAATLLDLARREPVLHVSSMYPAAVGCIAMVLPLARHPVNANGILVYDLRHDPGPFLGLDVEALRERLFTPACELPEGAARLPVKTVHLNKCPVLVPLSTLTERAEEEWGIDPVRSERHAAEIAGAGDSPGRVARCFAESPFEPETDPDAGLYGGGFFSDADRRLIEQVRAAEPVDLAALRPPFEDPRLPEMLFRYRARNWPESLSREERARWEAFRLKRLHGEGATTLGIAEYRARLARLIIDPAMDEAQRELLSALADWPERIGLAGT